MDKNGYDIDKSSLFTLKPMNAFRPIQFATAIANSTEVGELTTYEFRFTSPVPLYKGDVLSLEGPEYGMFKEISYNYKRCKGKDQL